MTDNVANTLSESKQKQRKGSATPRNDSAQERAFSGANHGFLVVCKAVSICLIAVETLINLDSLGESFDNWPTIDYLRPLGFAWLITLGVAAMVAAIWVIDLLASLVDGASAARGEAGKEAGANASRLLAMLGMLAYGVAAFIVISVLVFWIVARLMDGAMGLAVIVAVALMLLVAGFCRRAAAALR